MATFEKSQNLVVGRQICILWQEMRRLSGEKCFFGWKIITLWFLHRWVELGGGEEQVLEKAAVAVDKVEDFFKVLQEQRNNNIQYKTTIQAITTTFALTQGDHQWGLQLTDILIDCGRDSLQARELRGVCLR